MLQWARINKVGKLKNKNKTGKIKSFLSALFYGVTFYVLLVILIGGSFLAFKVYSQESEAVVQSRGTQDVEKGSSIILLFSSSMLKDSVQVGLSVEPSFEFETKWNSNREIEIIPTENLKPESEYQISVSGAKTKWRVPLGRYEIDVSTPQMPNILSIYPKDGQVEVDYYEKIMIEFDRAVRDEFIVRVGVSPLSTGFDHSFNQNKTQLVLSPKVGMEKNVTYTATVSLEDKYFPDIKKQLHKSSFTTKPPPVIVYSLKSNGEPLKTEERKEEVSPQIKDGKYIDIDLSSQALFLFQGGEELGAYKVSTGLRGMDTPIGKFKVIARSRRPWSAKYKLFMPWFIQFTYEGHGIHELPEWPGGYKEGENHLGIPVSHGCVRLGIGPAKVVYDFAEPGTAIIVHQ